MEPHFHPSEIVSERLGLRIRRAFLLSSELGAEICIVVCPEDWCREVNGLPFNWSRTMSIFNVWIRPLSSACRVRVDGILNARWLLNRLSESFVFKNSEPMDEHMEAACSSFQVQYSFQMSGLTFAKLLAAIPEVNLMLEPA
jgi:hypothetical protein